MLIHLVSLSTTACYLPLFSPCVSKKCMVQTILKPLHFTVYYTKAKPNIALVKTSLQRSIPPHRITKLNSNQVCLSHQSDGITTSKTTRKKKSVCKTWVSVKRFLNFEISVPQRIFKLKSIINASNIFCQIEHSK